MTSCKGLKRTIFVAHITDGNIFEIQRGSCNSQDFIDYEILYRPLILKEEVHDDEEEEQTLENHNQTIINNFIEDINDKIGLISDICISLLILIKISSLSEVSIDAFNFFLNSLPREVLTNTTVYVLSYGHFPKVDAGGENYKFIVSLLDNTDFYGVKLLFIVLKPGKIDEFFRSSLIIKKLVEFRIECFFT